MKTLALTVSARSRRLLAMAVCVVLVVLALASLPFFADVLARLADWFTRLLPHPSHLWKESPWLY